jgi:hypothetical protein
VTVWVRKSDSFEELLKFLNARHVSAIIVGGHVLAFHGHPRYTKDLAGIDALS